jgi:hypothetical protein
MVFWEKTPQIEINPFLPGERKKSVKFQENGASPTSSSPYATSPKTHLLSSRRHKNTRTLS